jgi:hypothetical protein
MVLTEYQPCHGNASIFNKFKTSFAHSHRHLINLCVFRQPAGLSVMKKLTLITLLAVPALLLAVPNAQAGNGHCCGEGRYEDSYRPYWDIYRVAVRTAVSDHPYSGSGTDIILKAGSVVRAHCFYNEGRRWCKIRTESIARAFIPRRCLERLRDDYAPSWYRYRRHHNNGRYENGYYFNEGNGNGNGYYNGARYDDGNGNGYYGNGNGNGRYDREPDGLSRRPWNDEPHTYDSFRETNGYRDR